MNTWRIILLIIGSILVGANLIVNRRILLADYQDEGRRKIHLWIVWLLPFLGIRITKFFWQKKMPGRKVVTKKDRKVDPGGFYENGTGLYGE